MSLRDRIKHVIDCVEDQDDSVCMDAAADAILALVRAHLTSDEAVERAQGHLRCEVSYATIGKCAVTPGDVMTKKAILAALGEGE